MDDLGSLGAGKEHVLAFESHATKTQAAFKVEKENLVLPNANKTGRFARSLNLTGGQAAFQGKGHGSSAPRGTADHPGARKDSAGKLGDTHATSIVSKPSPAGGDPFKKLASMEEYCKEQNIFFNESDRIKHQIKKSKGLYQEFKGSLQRGFNFNHGEDHPDLAELLSGT